MTAAEKYGIVILAAGNSSRLGQPKQLIEFNHGSLLHHTIAAAIEVAGKQVVVVTGAHQISIAEEVNKLPVHIVHNEYWQEGMASSIYTGLISLLKMFPQLDGIIFSVCDQPFISPVIFKNMIKKQQETGKGIVAAFYNNTAGVPVLFKYNYVGALLNLKGQEGAKALLSQFQNDVEVVPFEKGEVDIDTAEDLVKLQNQNIV